jgi:hypothetical protein
MVNRASSATRLLQSPDVAASPEGSPGVGRVWRANAALVAAEHDAAGAVELDALSVEVIAATIERADERMAIGWEPSSDARSQLDRDRQLLREGQGAMDPASIDVRPGVSPGLRDLCQGCGHEPGGPQPQPWFFRFLRLGPVPARCRHIITDHESGYPSPCSCPALVHSSQPTAFASPAYHPVTVDHAA